MVRPAFFCWGSRNHATSQGPSVLARREPPWHNPCMKEAIQRVRIRNFKSIESADLRLEPLNVLIGANGVGKSNFLSLFTFLNRLCDKNLAYHVASEGGAGSFLHRGPSVSETMGFILDFESDRGTNSYEAQLSYVAPRYLIFDSEEIRFCEPSGGREPAVFPLGGRDLESRLKDATESGRPKLRATAKFIKIRLDRWRAYHFHDTSKRSRIKSDCFKHDKQFLWADAGNLAPFLYWLRDTYPWHYSQIRTAIQIVYPEFDDFVLEEDPPSRGEEDPPSRGEEDPPSRGEEDPPSRGKISLAWRERNSDYLVRAFQGSDGTLRFMCLATLLLQPLEHTADNRNAPYAILIDEPELGLHPLAISVLAELLQAAARHTQIVVSTQSPNLLTEIDRADGTIIVDRSSAGSTILRKLDADSLKDWLDDYSLGDAWQKEIFNLGGLES